MAAITKRSISGFNSLEVPYILLGNGKPTRNLAIMLPGAGYTTQAPLFHYTTELFLNRGWDVLEVNYRYNDPAYDRFSTDDLAGIIRHDVNIVLDEVLGAGAYDNFSLIGKSLGTLAMCSERTRKAFQKARMAWLTPLIHRDDVLDAMLQAEQPGLAVIGDRDNCYSEERYQKLAGNPELAPSLMPGVGHGLDYAGDVQQSIDALKEILKAIEEFAFEEE